jgi:ABC-type uncharacterized transport system involved in gliding motility auxiliary subunit
MTGLPALLGALGLVGVLFALLSFVLALFGAPSDPGWIWANFIVGLTLLGSAVALSFDALRERIQSGEARRASKFGSSAILSTVFAVAILGLLGFLAERYSVRFDWSEQKIHSLSDQTRKVLDALEEDVEAVAFFQTLDQPPVRDLLDRYSYQSDRFHAEYIDPNAHPERLERYQITPQELGRGLVRIALGEEAIEIQEVTEEEVTNAMVKLTRTSEKKVYFVEGHNERAVEGEAADQELGYGRAAEALRNENYRVEKLLLAAQGDVPEDADVVIVAGATRPLLQHEHAALSRFLERGGALLALVDPRANTDLVDDLGEWGVKLSEDIVVDSQRRLFGWGPATPFAGKYDPNHEITADLREPTVFHIVRSVVPRDGDGAGDFTEIVFTGDRSWAERDLRRFFSEETAELGDEDLPGPVPIAVAGRPAVEGEGDPRLAVFGDADFASNQWIETLRNRDLFLNTVNWLLGDVEAISIRPNLARASRFQLTAAQFITIRSLSLFVLPEAIAVVGVLTWWVRRRAPGE